MLVQGSVALSIRKKKTRAKRKKEALNVESVWAWPEVSDVISHQYSRLRVWWCKKCKQNEVKLVDQKNSRKRNAIALNVGLLMAHIWTLSRHPVIVIPPRTTSMRPMKSQSCDCKPSHFTLLVNMTGTSHVAQDTESLLMEYMEWSIQRQALARLSNHYLSYIQEKRSLPGYLAPYALQ
ncbi:uncharacterized protein MYCFIDRAFT_170630 [Pseudocercospora fijiensis CIRAD86]|uniref:Uncharacterized protein n=1 Tax=Pseudocercospora fijiensis (strain CIRAD86) TaxID=383855 RepID=N1QCG3_PSEFD|nr:uncharacterized protein MYCFIDRAFT_170630 [Pseudocercospora fijiensis CIRAD86]EME89118.1 hypothetical protein MYCFIDRAFT_170630 [Pseudocercospora fijiensis CIRAD86]